MIHQKYLYFYLYILFCLFVVYIYVQWYRHTYPKCMECKENFEPLSASKMNDHWMSLSSKLFDTNSSLGKYILVKNLRPSTERETITLSNSTTGEEAPVVEEAPIEEAPIEEAPVVEEEVQTETFLMEEMNIDYIEKMIIEYPKMHVLTVDYEDLELFGSMAPIPFLREWVYDEGTITLILKTEFMKQYPDIASFFQRSEINRSIIQSAKPKDIVHVAYTYNDPPNSSTKKLGKVEMPLFFHLGEYIKFSQVQARKTNTLGDVQFIADDFVAYQECNQDVNCKGVSQYGEHQYLKMDSIPPVKLWEKDWSDTSKNVYVKPKNVDDIVLTAKCDYTNYMNTDEVDRLYVRRSEIPQYVMENKVCPEPPKSSCTIL